MTHLHIAVFLILLSVGLPTVSRAVTYFEDNYELPCTTPQLAQFTGELCKLTGSSGGVNPPLNMSISSSTAFSGSQSLKFHYVGTDSGGFIDRQFGSFTEHLFIRWYYRPVSMTFNNVGTKILFAGNTNAGTTPNFWLNATTNAKIHFVWNSHVGCGLSCNFFQNVGAGVAFTDNVWHCVEAEIKMNTPGVADGWFRLWVNGVLALEYLNQMLRGAGNTSGFNSYRLFVQHGVGDTYYDLLAAGNTRIGCAGAPLDTTPPSAPTNLFVQ